MVFFCLHYLQIYILLEIVRYNKIYIVGVNMNNNEYKELKTYDEMTRKEKRKNNLDEKIEKSSWESFICLLTFQILLIAPTIVLLIIKAPITKVTSLFLLFLILSVGILILGVLTIKEFIFLLKKKKEETLLNRKHLDYKDLLIYKDDLEEKPVLKSKTGQAKFELDKKDTEYKDAKLALSAFFISLFVFVICLFTIEEKLLLLWIWCIYILLFMFLGFVRWLIVKKNRKDGEKKSE